MLLQMVKFCFLWLSSIALCVCVCTQHLLYSSVEGHLGFFHILAVVNNAAVNTGEHVSFLLSVLGHFGYIPRSGISRSYGSSTIVFWETSLTVLHRGCTNLYSHQQCTGFPFLHILARMCCRLFDDGHSDRCEVTSVVLIHISPMASDAEYLFTCLSAIRM